MDRGFEERFIQGRYKNDQQEHSKILNIMKILMEMQVKTTVKYHFSPIMVTIIKRTRIKLVLEVYGEIGTLVDH